jgi:predicted amidohydrolase YtcJ
MIIQSNQPDVILYHGRFYTLDPSLPIVEAVSVKNGRFQALGTSDEILQLAGEGTQKIDLQGRVVIPGIFDSHNHLMEVGQKRSMIRLDECASPEEMMELVRERAKVTPPGTWIVGMGWNEGIFKDGRLPTRHDIDPATDQHPVLLMRFFNTDVVNTTALRLAGIDRRSTDPQGGKIEHDQDGEPNGLLRASAKRLVRSLVPAPTLEERKNWIRLGAQDMHRFGITSVIDPGLIAEEIRAYQSLYAEGGLTMRVNLMPSWHGFHDFETTAHLEERARQLGIFSGLGDEWLRIGALKMALDGGTTPHTAYMYEPFLGETEVRDFNRMDYHTLERNFSTAQELGWDVGIHCCGDRAQDLVVEALTRVMEKQPRQDTRHSIIHAYFPTPRAMELMSRYKIAAVLQPTFIYYEGELLFRDVGDERAHRFKPARTYLENGILITASSDVESTVSANPFNAMYSLITRKNRFGQVIGPNEGISRTQALSAYTEAGSWLTREEKLKGIISLDKLADMAVLDRDYFTVSDEEIKDIRVVMTLVGGKVFWQQT